MPIKPVHNLGPGVLWSIALHLIVGAALVVLYVKEVRERDDEVPRTIVPWVKPPVPEPDSPPELPRQGVPLNRETQLVPVTGENQIDDISFDDVDLDPPVNVEPVPSGGGLEGDGEVFTSGPLGKGSSLGTPIGVGSGGSRPGRGGPPGFRNRGIHGPGGRRGIPQGTEAAVLYGLTWLARHQMPDGSWDAVAYQDRCQDASCTGPGHVRFSDGLTGLSLLAFLGAGYTHDSKQFVKDPKTGDKISFGEVVKKGLKYLVDKQQPDGSFGSDKYMYNQSICTMALNEAYALTGASFFRGPAQKSLDFIQSAQNSDSGGSGFLGWRYQPLEGASDTSVTGWCIMALKSGELANLKVNPQSMEGGLKWVKFATNNDFKTGYLSAADAGQKIENSEEMGKFDHHESMTAVGMMVRTFVTFEWRDPSMEKGASHLMNDLPTWEPQGKRDFYYWYYASLALNQYSGPDSPNTNKTFWTKWNEKLVPALVAHQENVPANQTAPKDYADLMKDAGERSCKTGSWEPADRYGYAGRIYATAINVLTLEVYYRFDNAFGTGRRAAPARTEDAGQNAPRPDRSR